MKARHSELFDLRRQALGHIAASTAEEASRFRGAHSVAERIYSALASAASNLGFDSRFVPVEGVQVLGAFQKMGLDNDLTLSKSYAGRAGDVNLTADILASPEVSKGALAKSISENAVLSKAVLDVGTLANFAQVTGGQALGYFSLDTVLRRGTARPRSMTLYNALAKTPANQIVDFWPYVDSTGGSLPGSAFNLYQSVATSPLTFNAGDYELFTITLKLLVDGRGITTALGAQNSFVNIADAETANAAISILESIDWASYWGNPAIYSNQFAGIYQQMKGYESQTGGNVSTISQSNFVNYYQEWLNTGPGSANYGGEGSAAYQDANFLFNLIYQTFGKSVAYGRYGRPTHCFMSPELYAAEAKLVVERLNNLVNIESGLQDHPLVINANYRGMRTGFGNLAFEIDLFLTARQRPAQGIIRSGKASSGSFVSPPVSVTLSAIAAPAGTTSLFDTTNFAGSYSYAVAATDASRNETNLVWASAPVTVAAGQVVQVTITPPTDGSAVGFIVYRSGKGYTYSSTDTTAVNQVRFIGEVAANGTTAVTFIDANHNIPGSQTIFMLDLDPGDEALDYRYLLPLSKIMLFENNLYMPWAVAHIGSPRVAVPKFHYVVENIFLRGGALGFDPLASSNPSAL